MDEYSIYKYIEFIMVSLYLMFFFLSIQIFFIWIDIDKNELRSKIFSNGSILKMSIVTVFFIGILLIIKEFIEGSNQTYLMVELFELLGFIFVVYFIYYWHLTLKSCSHKKKPASDFILDACMSGRVNNEPYGQFLGQTTRIFLNVIIAIGILRLMLALFIPITTIYFTLVIAMLFVPPILALASTILGGFLVSKEIYLK